MNVFSTYLLVKWCASLSHFTLDSMEMYQLSFVRRNQWKTNSLSWLYDELCIFSMTGRYTTDYSPLMENKNNVFFSSLSTSSTLRDSYVENFPNCIFFSWYMQFLYQINLVFMTQSFLLSFVANWFYLSHILCYLHALIALIFRFVRAYWMISFISWLVGNHKVLVYNLCEFWIEI